MYDLVVIGAGLAGCAVARQLGGRHRVLLLESERYPVHKMCGEFLSPEASELFVALGVADRIRSSGAVPIRRVRVTAPSGAEWQSALPGAGLGLSRWALDKILFDAAVEAGAEGRQGARVRDVSGDAASGFTVTYESDGERRDVAARLVVGAFGKRSALDRALGRAERDAANLVAFKMHFTGADIGDVVELHGFDGGYCGMSHVEEGRVNVCLIARAEAVRASGGSFAGMCDGVLRTNPALAHRLERLSPAMERPVAISQVPCRTRSLFAGDVVMVGDTAAMIAPLCGDGMSMALRGAAIAAPLLSDVLAGARTFEELRATYAREWRRSFSTRLRLGRWLQAALFQPAVARAVEAEGLVVAVVGEGDAGGGGNHSRGSQNDMARRASTHGMDYTLNS